MVTKSTPKTLGGRKFIKIQNTLGGKALSKKIKIKRENSFTSWALLGLWLGFGWIGPFGWIWAFLMIKKCLGLPCVGLYLIVNPISLEHLLDSIISH